LFHLTIHLISLQLYLLIHFLACLVHIHDPTSNHKQSQV
jgi:hypothetical protein